MTSKRSHTTPKRFSSRQNSLTLATNQTNSQGSFDMIVHKHVNFTMQMLKKKILTFDLPSINP